MLVRKLAGLVPHASGELAPRLALIASLCFPSVVCVGSAPGPTAFPAEAVEAVVGGRLVTRSALSLLPSVHGSRSWESHAPGKLEPKWLRRFGVLRHKKVSNTF